MWTFKGSISGNAYDANLKDAIDLAKEHPDLDYVYVDVNCRLKDGTSIFLTTLTIQNQW